mgnify:FL=1
MYEEQNQFDSDCTGQSFQDHEPSAEPVRDIELHAMMGKRPLHVSSDFLGETLAAISVKPDGFKRYSYKSLINPDLSRVILFYSGLLRP